MAEGEQQDFGKFIRFFSTRLVQSLVQARLGRSVETVCNVTADARDWFNVNIEELGEVTAYVKTAVSRFPPNSPCFALDFLLYTADHEYLPLESWRVSVEEENVDDSVNIRTQFYHQLGTLLKSAAAAARVTPCHRYFVRKQSAESFVIMYQVRDTDDDLEMGEDAKKRRLGKLASPFGTLCLDLVYRTNMAVSPKFLANPDMIPDELQLPERPKMLPLGESTAVNIPPTPSSRNISEFSTSPNDLAFPFIRSPNAPAASKPIQVPSSRFRLGHSTSSEESSPQPESSSVPSSFRRTKNPSGGSLGGLRSSFSQTRGRNNSFPFAVLLSSTREPLYSKRNSTCAAGISNELLSEEMEGKEEGDRRSEEANVEKKDDEGEEGRSDSETEGGLEMHSSDDSYVKVFAFAHGVPLPTEGNSELGEFIKECRQAPNSLPTLAHTDTADAIREQLHQFKAQEGNFDAFVQMIKQKVAEEDYN